jgi:hypothetical protein
MLIESALSAEKKTIVEAAEPVPTVLSLDRVARYDVHFDLTTSWGAAGAAAWDQRTWRAPHGASQTPGTAARRTTTCRRTGRRRGIPALEH